MDLGFSNQKKDSLEFDQRRAIIIGVRERDSSISVDAALSMIVARANIGVINLGHYSNFSNLNLEEVAWVEADGSSSKHE